MNPSLKFNVLNIPSLNSNFQKIPNLNTMLLNFPDLNSKLLNIPHVSIPSLEFEFKLGIVRNLWLRLEFPSL